MAPSKMNDKALLVAATRRAQKEKIQWTKTPEGREYMSRAMKRRRARNDPSLRRKTAASTATEVPSTNPTVNVPLAENFEYQVAYVYGRIESQLEVYANQLGIAFPELAQRLSELLRGKAHGKMVRAAHRVSSVR